MHDAEFHHHIRAGCCARCSLQHASAAERTHNGASDRLHVTRHPEPTLFSADPAPGDALMRRAGRGPFYRRTQKRPFPFVFLILSRVLPSKPEDREPLSRRLVSPSYPSLACHPVWQSVTQVPTDNGRCHGPLSATSGLVDLHTPAGQFHGANFSLPSGRIGLSRALKFWLEASGVRRDLHTPDFLTVLVRVGGHTSTLPQPSRRVNHLFGAPTDGATSRKGAGEKGDATPSQS